MQRLDKEEKRIQQLKAELSELLGVPVKKPQDGKHQERLKLSGRYMGLTRHLSVAEKARIRKIRLTEGIEAAIDAAAKLHTH